MPPNGPVGAVERGEPAAGLAHDHVERGHVVDARARARRRGRRHPRRAACRTRSRRTPGCASSAASATGSRRAGRAPPSRGGRSRTATRPRGGVRRRPGSGVALSSDRPVQAPLPVDAHQRRCSCGADTTPSTTSSSTTSAIRVAQTGTPRTKFLVPSIGSTTQRRWLCPVEPCSSPVTASRERTRDSVRRMLSSTAWSASVTGVRSGLLITCRSSALNRAAGQRVGVVGEHVREAQVVGVVRAWLGTALTLCCTRTDPRAEVPCTSHGDQRTPAAPAGRPRRGRLRAARRRSPALALRRGPVVARPAALAARWRSSLIAVGVDLWRPTSAASNFLDSDRFDELERARRRCRSSTTRTCAGIAALGRRSRLRRRRAGRRAGSTTATGARRASCSACLLVVGAVATLVCVVPHRRRRRPGRSGAAEPRRSTPARCRAASSRRNDSTRSGSASPAATASSSPHSGSSAPWVQPRGQSSVISSRSGNASIRSSGSHVGEPERPDARGVDDPARRPSGQREHERRGRGVPAAAGDRVDDADVAVGVRHQRVDQRRLADAAVPDQHAGPARAAASRSSVRSPPRWVTTHGTPERAVGRRAASPGRRGRPWSGTAAAAMPGVVRRDQRPVDQPRPRLGVGQRGDDDELVGVGDDHPLDRVVVVGRTPQHGRPLARPRRSGPASRRRRTTSPTTRTRSPTTTPLRPSGRAFIAITVRPSTQQREAAAVDGDDHAVDGVVVGRALLGAGPGAAARAVVVLVVLVGVAAGRHGVTSSPAQNAGEVGEGLARWWRRPRPATPSTAAPTITPACAIRWSA